MLLFHSASVEEGDAFFSRAWPEARVVADPDQRVYAGFGLRDGSWWQLLGPRVWLAALRAVAKRHFVGRPRGNVRSMPWVFLVRRDEVIWQHGPRHAGDHPDHEVIAMAAQHLRAAASA